MKTLLASALAMTCLLSACASAPPPPVRTLTDADAGAVVLARGQGLEIALPLNAGTGYGWRLDAEATATVLSGGSSRQTNAALPGGPITTIYGYQAAGRGKADLSFTLKQPWMPDSPSDRRVVFHVKVR